jgi:hypothetical protein
MRLTHKRPRGGTRTRCHSPHRTSVTHPGQTFRRAATSPHETRYLGQAFEVSRSLALSRSGRLIVRRLSASSPQTALSWHYISEGHS